MKYWKDTGKMHLQCTVSVHVFIYDNIQDTRYEFQPTTTQNVKTQTDSKQRYITYNIICLLSITKTKLEVNKSVN